MGFITHFSNCVCDATKQTTKWFRCARYEKIPVGGEMLLLKEQAFASVCGYDNSEKLDIN